MAILQKAFKSVNTSLEVGIFSFACQWLNLLFLATHLFLLTIEPLWCLVFCWDCTNTSRGQSFEQNTQGTNNRFRDKNKICKNINKSRNNFFKHKIKKKVPKFGSFSKGVSEKDEKRQQSSCQPSALLVDSASRDSLSAAEARWDANPPRVRVSWSQIISQTNKKKKPFWTSSSSSLVCQQQETSDGAAHTLSYTHTHTLPTKPSPWHASSNPDYLAIDLQESLGTAGTTLLKQWLHSYSVTRPVVSA